MTTDESQHLADGPHDGAPPRAGTGTRLTYNSPLSPERALLIRETLQESPIQDVLDIGCGWGSLLLDILEDNPAAHGTGVDLHEPDIARAQDDAERRGLEPRVRFVPQDAGTLDITADLVMNIGAFHIYGDIPTAFEALRERTLPTGRLVFGTEYATHIPTAEELANVWEGSSAEDFILLPDVVDQAVAAGFRPLLVTTVSQQEWEVYESGHMREREEWLVANPGHHQAAEIRDALDEQRRIWLRGHRSFLGFAYLVLGATAA